MTNLLIVVAIQVCNRRRMGRTDVKHIGCDLAAGVSELVKGVVQAVLGHLRVSGYLKKCSGPLSESTRLTANLVLDGHNHVNKHVVQCFRLAAHVQLLDAEAQAACKALGD